MCGHASYALLSFQQICTMNGNERRQRKGNWLNPGALKCLKPIRPSSAKKRLNHRYTSKRLVRICVCLCVREREKECGCV